MGGIVGGSKSVEAPAPKPVEPPPTVETAGQAATQTRKRGRTARQATFLTGDLVPVTDKKSVLG
jgi:hypothetical protein